MRRKYRKWMAIAVVFYALLLWSAWRWSISERESEGNIFNVIEHQGIHRLATERAEKEKTLPQPTPTGESRLKAAGPAFVAARYDATHVVFVVADDTESRFSTSPQIRLNGTPTRIAASTHPAAPLAGLQELWEPDSHSLHFFPKIVRTTQPGENWILSLTPDSTIPVVIDRPVIAPTGCSLAMGFLASVPPDQQSAFAAASREYFTVRRTAVESADPPVQSHIAELPGWKPSPAIAKQIEQQLTDRMKQEVAQIDARLLANAAGPGEAAGELPIASARPHLKEWIRADRGLTRGDGKLDYDVRAFHLTPDAAPRLFVRARWSLNDAAAFLMTAWFKLDTPKLDSPKSDSPQPDSPPTDSPRPAAQALLLSADSSWSKAMREGESSATLGDRLDFQTILNEFDADHDGWAELLIHSDDAHSEQPASTTITLFLYTDLGLVPLKSPLRRDAQSPESCVDP